MHTSTLSFNAGELSPYLRHRADFQKTAAGAERMENFLPLPHGAAVKRPGLQHLAAATAATNNTRLLPFLASDGSRYLLHFTPGTLTIYRPNGTTAASLTFLSGQTWPSTFDPADSLRLLHIVQANDVAFITHPRTHPLRLSRLSDTSWVLEFLPFTRAPMREENLDDTKTLRVLSNPIAPGWTSGSTYTAASHVFLEDIEWSCLAAHIADNTNRPGNGANWRSFWRRRLYLPGDPITINAEDISAPAWNMLYTAWNVGDFIAYPSALTSWTEDTDDLALCLVAHTAEDSPSLPIVASLLPLSPGWQWIHVKSWVSWSAGSNLATEDELYYHNGSVYLCILGHVLDADPATEPGVGASSATYWTTYTAHPTIPAAPTLWKGQNQYPIAATVSRGGRTFTATALHTPASTNAPGTGASWEAVWSETSRFLQTFTASATSPGQSYLIAPERDARDQQIEIAALTTNNGQRSPAIAVAGGWNLFTFGTWTGTFILEKSVTAGRTWEDVRSWQSTADRNVADSGFEDSAVLLRLRFESAAGTASTGNQRAVLIPESPAVAGEALATAYTAGDSMVGIARTPLLSGKTARWSEGAFSSRHGYPRAITLHESRLVLAGTASDPVTLWLSQTDDLLNFATGPDATDSLRATLALSPASPILWLASQRRLFIGTRLGEWVAGSETSDSPITPTTFLARQYSAHGSGLVPPILAAEALLYLSRETAHLRAIGYQDASQSYDSADLSILAEHLFRAGILAAAWQPARLPTLWLIDAAGRLLSFSWTREEAVAAYARHPSTAATFLDCAVLPSVTGRDDDVFFLTQRHGTTVLERLPSAWLSAIETAPAALSTLALDAATSGTGTTIPVPAHLLNQPLTLLHTDSAGALTIETITPTSSPLTRATAATWQLGIPIQAALVSLPLDAPGMDSSQAREKRPHKIVLSLMYSKGGRVWNRTESQAQPIAYPLPTPYTGWTETTPDPGHLPDLALRILHPDPHPFLLRSAVLRWQIQEP
jgi:hypothetical protein